MWDAQFGDGGWGANYFTTLLSVVAPSLTLFKVKLHIIMWSYSGGYPKMLPVQLPYCRTICAYDLSLFSSLQSPTYK